MAETEAQKRARVKYRKAHNKEQIRQIKLDLRYATDSDLIGYLDSLENKSGYIKSLIRADMQSRTESK